MRFGHADLLHVTAAHGRLLMARRDDQQIAQRMDGADQRQQPRRGDAVVVGQHNQWLRGHDSKNFLIEVDCIVPSKSCVILVEKDM
ncbi:MAG: hypothetical protein C4327_14835 [Meiothermus sp.]